MVSPLPDHRLRRVESDSDSRDGPCLADPDFSKQRGTKSGLKHGRVGHLSNGQIDRTPATSVGNKQKTDISDGDCQESIRLVGAISKTTGPVA